MIVLTAMFTLITAPVVAHRVGRLAYREHNIRRDLLTIDELHDNPPEEIRDGQNP